MPCGFLIVDPNLLLLLLANLADLSILVIDQSLLPATVLVNQIATTAVVLGIVVDVLININTNTDTIGTKLMLLCFSMLFF